MSKTKTKTKIKAFRSVWDAIADTPEQSANLQARAELMQQIAAIIKANDWKQADAATHCGVTQPRINDLLRGRVSRFSLDALVNIATALGRRVRRLRRAGKQLDQDHPWQRGVRLPSPLRPASPGLRWKLDAPAGREGEVTKPGK